MISDDFSVGLIASENFCVCVRPDEFRFVPVDSGVRTALRSILIDTVAALEQRPGVWERLEISEDYGEPRKLYARRTDELLARLSGLYDLGDPGVASNISEDAARVEFYFVQFWDRNHQKIVGLAKSSQFKSQLKARNRLMGWSSDTLKAIPDDVFRLKDTFDTLITERHIYIFDARLTLQVARVVEEVSRAAVARATDIESCVSFLDLSAVKQNLPKQARKAQLVTAVARRDDLASIDRALLEGVCRQHGIELTERDGKLMPSTRHEIAFLEILDARRYAGQIIANDTSRYRATGRHRVT